MQAKVKPENERIAERLIELRKANRYTQDACGKALGIGQSAYAEMETGETKVRRRDMVTLCVLYGCAVEEAFAGLLDTEPEAA